METSGREPVNLTYWTVYKYDEAGNRIRKTTNKYLGSEPDPVYEDGGDNPQWQLTSDEYYVRDISGKEIVPKGCLRHDIFIYKLTVLEYMGIG